MMEMDSNPITKPSKKGAILSTVFYALAVVLLITAFVSLAACHQNITRQLEQGVPVQGNELAIVNLYLTSCVQYFAFAVAMVFCGKAVRRVLAIIAKRRYRSLPICSIPRQRLPVPIMPRKLSRRRTIRILRLGDSGKRKNKKRHAGGLAEQQALGHVLKTGEWRWFPCSKQSGFIVPSAGIKPVIESGRIQF